MLDASRSGSIATAMWWPLAWSRREAEERIRLKSFGPIVAVKRLPALGAD
jgi:hypothetical protein